jgi:hypothetical protein
MKKGAWLSLHVANKGDSVDAKETLTEHILLNEQLAALSRKISLLSVDGIYEAITKAGGAIRGVEIGDDEFFHSRRKKLAFCILRNARGDLDADLGLTPRHFLDEQLAKQWRDMMLSEFHPDKRPLGSNEEQEQITKLINKTYNRLVGKA